MTEERKKRKKEVVATRKEVNRRGGTVRKFINNFMFLFKAELRQTPPCEVPLN